MGLILRRVLWVEVMLRVVKQELPKSKQKMVKFTESSEMSRAHTCVLAPIFMAPGFFRHAVTIFDESVGHLSSSFLLFQ